jgi:hypothetical protein
VDKLPPSWYSAARKSFYIHKTQVAIIAHLNALGKGERKEKGKRQATCRVIIPGAA